MPLLSLLYKIAPTSIGSIELDAAISISHRAEVEVTQHPVEKGADIADHLRPKPEIVTIEGVVSNTPINVTQQTRAVEFVGTGFRAEFQTTAREEQPFGVPGYAEEAYAKLRDIKDNRELVTIVTPLKTYENMALTSLEIPQDAKTGDSLRFTATFQNVRVVENKVTNLKVATDPRANKKAKLGKQAAEILKQDANAVRKIAQPWTDTIGKGFERINIFGFGE